MPQKIKASWLYRELYTARNIRPYFQYGLYMGIALSALDTYLLRGHAPWTLKHKADDKTLKPAAKYKEPIDITPDGRITFDLPSSVFLSNTNHEENQPCHLTLTEPEKAINLNLEIYASPETRYCPAAVYEILEDSTQQPYLQINAQNCLHCKCCDIKDENIVWTPPEGGGGPNYPNM